MIPWLATIVAAYTLTRCLDVFLREDTGRPIEYTALFAMLIILASIGMIWNISLSSSTKVPDMVDTKVPDMVDY